MNALKTACSSECDLRPGAMAANPDSQTRNLHSHRPSGDDFHALEG